MAKPRKMRGDLNEWRQKNGSLLAGRYFMVKRERDRAASLVQERKISIVVEAAWRLVTEYLETLIDMMKS
jgi:hypothetical protein